MPIPNSLCDGQAVGWSMRDPMQTNAVTDALRMAWFSRCPHLD
jgi:transposase InsO family protein